MAYPSRMPVMSAFSAYEAATYVIAPFAFFVSSEVDDAELVVGASLLPPVDCALLEDELGVDCPHDISGKAIKHPSATSSPFVFFILRSPSLKNMEI
jgi:hypothetical protein